MCHTCDTLLCLRQASVRSTEPAYLRDVLARLPKMTTKDDLDAITPANWRQLRKLLLFPMGTIKMPSPGIRPDSYSL